ncbi:hypothetical protein SLU01_35400 [Sporosarcina luteola]|uniref:Uncharacterized protein n=1 Tax=Sporosarcina luteola TaxID=582850 RepID=A0A511ZCQ3_9BACL|nr:hypothetical protein SLU01_35400 [Sporosarcina luteola]
MYKRELSRACGCASKADGRTSKAEGRASKMARPDSKEPYLFCFFYAGNHDLSLLGALYIL